MAVTRIPARPSRTPADQLVYEALMEKKQKEINDATRRNAVGGVFLRKKKKRKRGSRGSNLKDGDGGNASDEEEGEDSPSSPQNDDPPSSSRIVDADDDSDVFRSTNSSSLEPEYGDSTCKEAEADSDLFKSTPSSIMELESGDGRGSSSSRRPDAEEDPEVYNTNCSTPLETESSVLSPGILDADEDSAIFSITSSKSSLLDELVRAVTQTQTSLLGNVTNSELRAEIVRLQKNNTLMTGNADTVISLCSPNSVTYEKTVGPPTTPMDQILSMQETDKGESYARRFVGVGGKHIEPPPTLPGKSYHSNDIQEPEFETNAKQSSLSYKDWKGDCEDLLVCTEEMRIRYKTFFEPEVDKTFKDKRVMARVGGQYIHIKDLKTLGPGEWLNDTIIDRMTNVLAPKTDTKSTRRVAVFDSHFKMITEQPGGNDRRYNRKFYHYDRIRTYAHRKLRGWSPLTIDCMLFPNNYGTLHWDLILGFPKQRHIVGLDSMHHNSHEDARIIFRWLFDETSYNYPGDVDKLFLPHTKDMRWTFRVDTSVPGQTDGFNCGVFLLGYVACVLYEMNPRRLY
jgi:hypothetical protein